MKKIGLREATREALQMAAAMIRDADHLSLFNPETLDGADEDVLQLAQDKAVRRVESLVPKRFRS